MSNSDAHRNANTNFAHVELLLERLRLPFLLRHLPSKLVWTTYVCINCFISIALLALLAEVSGSPFVFPSLGPTAYLFFFSPLAEVSSPRNTILGHAVGLICGYGAFWVTGMHAFSQATGQGIYWPRIFAAALALAATGALMVLFSVSHPPAGATTLIVALGILAKFQYLFVIEAAVVLLTIQAWVFNHLAGLPYPKWHTPKG
ncbi:HPP family protein [Edaphobacter albus]|uniref:HPP family protein n=1 Tax=Edaphobacter sp. 4G125 TaxID=2763071 RepID=UPI001646C791|nr:HPP family protein [Edaphobacter sp. 4G125]QNI36952.1 HPP family protein [Edaphobacter sp. 4G125]